MGCWNLEPNSYFIHQAQKAEHQNLNFYNFLSEFCCFKSHSTKLCFILISVFSPRLNPPALLPHSLPFRDVVTGVMAAFLLCVCKRLLCSLLCTTRTECVINYTASKICKIIPACPISCNSKFTKFSFHLLPRIGM